MSGGVNRRKEGGSGRAAGRGFETQKQKAKQVTKRIWVVDYTGRLGNRLRLLTHLAAAAREHGLAISNPAFWKYRQDFHAWRNNGLDFVPGGSPWFIPPRLERLLRGLVCRLAQTAAALPGTGRWLGWLRCPDEELVDLDSGKFRELLSGGPRHLFLWGYNFHAAPLVQKHRAELRKLFHPRREIRKADGFRVALHARRGDYQGWSGGRYYFGWNRYLDWMRQAQQVWGHHSPKILIFSDEEVPKEIASEPGVEVAEGAPGQDLFLMASCDVILGPPSSFSDWAAWYGGAKRLRIERPEQELKSGDLVDVEAP